MKEIDANKKAWGRLAEHQYEWFKKQLQERQSLLSGTIENELGDIAGKKIIHLQCNTGADSISLARKGAVVTGVDLAPENIFYAEKLARELNVPDINFIESDIMELMQNHHEQYDIVFTSEGAIGWLPDLDKWGETVRHLLRKNGFFYISEIHPFFLMFDEAKMKNNETVIAYPYFGKVPEHEVTIGSYTSFPQRGDNYFWMYTVSDIINALAKNGLTIEYFNEFDHLCYDLDGMEKVAEGNYHYPFFDKKMPFMFSLKASLK